MRSLLQRSALAFGAVVGLLGTRPATANAQKALVYCPVSIDATGCNAIVTALTGPAYPLGVDRGYDGTDGTVDLKAVDLFSYSVFVVPSLADDSTSQPYATLRDPEVAEHLKAALIGRIAMWSGTPDQGATNRAMKDALVQNLAAWAGGAFATAKGPGLVTLLDASASAVSRYDWVRAITPLPVMADPTLLIYNSVRALDQRATTMFTSGTGAIAYSNMATFGFQVPNGAAGVNLDAVGQTGTSQGGQVVLLTMEAGNAGGATVRTDRNDYAPGETVTITGAGWQSGETVKLTLHMDPLRDADTELTATADGSGTFTNTGFAPGAYDVGVRFVLTAVGQASGSRAQTTFTDGNARLIHSNNVGDFTGSFKKYSANATCSGTPSATGSGTVTNNAGGTGVSVANNSNESASFTVPSSVSGVPFAGWIVPAGTTFSGSLTNPVDFCVAGSTPNVNVTANYSATLGTTTTPSNVTTTYGTASVNLSATVTSTSTVNSGTVTFTVKQGATTIGSATTSGTVTGGSASVTYSLPVGTASGTYTIQADYNAGTGFAGSSGTATLTISTRAITVTADAKTKVYGDIDPTLTYQITSGSLAAGDAFSGSLTRAAGENVGSYAIQKGTLALSANYVLTYVGASLTISTRAVTVTADAKAKVYGTADPALTYQITVGSLAFSDAFSGALTRVAGNNVGAYAIQQGTLALNANYALSYLGANLTITGRPLTVTADAKSKGYGDADPSLTYQVTSGTLAAGDALTGGLTRVAGENVGAYAIQQGALTAGTNYDLAFVGANLTITTRAIAVAADPQTKVYGNVDPALTYQVTSGSLINGDAFSGSLSRAAGEGAGSYAITQGTLSAGGNYALSFTGANLTITTRPIAVTADPKTKVYGDADPTLTYQITSGSLVFEEQLSGNITRATGENVGSYAITQGTLAATTNYELTFVPSALTITKRQITVTANPQTKVYGNADPAFTYAITTGNLVGTDGLTGTLSRASGEDVGTYAITQGGLTAGGNYDLTFAGALLTVTKRAVTVTANPNTKTYGDADPTLTYAITTGSLAFSDAFSGALTREAGENVGTYAIQQGALALSANYELSFVGANFTITKRAVAITADAKTKTYGDADPALTYHISAGSLAFSDAVTGSLTRVAGENVGSYAIQQNTVALNPTNYTLTYVGANLTISQRTLNVTADDASRIAGALNPTFTGTVNGVQFSDNITATYSTTAVTLSLPGTYPIVPAIVDPNSKIGNYDVHLYNGTLTVTPNAKPVLGAFTGPLLPVALGSSIAISIPFTDVDVAASQPYTATIAWGDGPNSTSTFTTPGTITGTKIYPAAGVYNVTVTVRQDNFPTTHFDTKTYEYYVVVYDPNGGFVTGGGWINSPAGAYYADPSLTGKANFGFVAKYKKGQTTPDGNTEFQYQAGNLNFKATSFDWLVIAGAKAQFKGSGTINGSGDYGFMLTGIDGELKGKSQDTFRMRIWIKATNAVVYDNLLNAPDSTDPTTVLGGGSIQIHDK